MRYTDWEKRVEAFEQSGMTQRAWCAATENSIHNLNYWLRKKRDHLKNDKADPIWLPLTVIGANSQQETAHIITMELGSIRILVEPGFSSEHLNRILRVVQAI